MSTTTTDRCPHWCAQVDEHDLHVSSSPTDGPFWVEAGQDADGAWVDIDGDVTGLSIADALRLLGDLERTIDLIEPDPFTNCMRRLDELNGGGAS
jgi:hypothetical protein